MTGYYTGGQIIQADFEIRYPSNEIPRPGMIWRVDGRLCMIKEIADVRWLNMAVMSVRVLAVPLPSVFQRVHEMIEPPELFGEG